MKEQRILRKFVMTILLSFALIALTTAIMTTTNDNINVHAQTKENSFDVILTLFGVNKNTGDVITFSSSENITHFKIFDPYEELAYGDTSEVLFNFNGTEVNAGDTFTTCILTIKDISVICKNGENSPAKRPEIVDINLVSDEATKIEVQNIMSKVGSEKDEDEDQGNKDEDEDFTDNQDEDEDDTEDKNPVIDSEIIQVQPGL
ncbi:MAG TPA: hypothetical protein VJ767_08910 [Nitrososphaeraceae archaeon]|nr:hypothetical protein [Nitrososphaeraceae archaeon]